MADPSITRVTLFVPGAESLRGARLGKSVEIEWVANDGHFGDAFSFGTVAPKVVKQIDNAPGALVLHFTSDLRESRSEIVAAVAALRDDGALAVRLEQSKMGWDVQRWLELFSSEEATSWHRGAVVFVGGNEVMQSCGMHAFSLPDVRLSHEPRVKPSTLQELGTLLNLYQLVEDPVIRSGQTFSPDHETPRRVLERWPDVEYPADHPCHNPYGVWRVGEAGGTARAMGELAPTFVPTLRALLAALESKAGRHLTRAQVEAARDGGTCIAMKPKDAQMLERQRGYADLDPELVWEQWKLVR
ncbi:MAG TPA: hypothetical protein VMZ53_33350 [Kofleriaceae bacterium]|nr:hypothetical protein [Kofleriaceae bacterium]